MLKRIAFLTDHSDPLAAPGSLEAGGENVYVLELTRSLAKLGWVIDVFTRWSSPKTTRIAKISPNVRVIRLKAGPIDYIPRDQLFPYMTEYVENFLAFVKETKSEYFLLHGNYYFSGWAGIQISQVLGIPHVNTFHTLGAIRHLVLGARDPSPKERIMLETEILNRADRIIATSPIMKDEMVKHYGAQAKKIVVVGGGVNLNRFTPTPQLLARRVLHLDQNMQMILYVGRVERRKGLDTLLSAMYDLARRVPEKRKFLKLYISGSLTQNKWDKMPEGAEKEELHRLWSIVEQLNIKDMVRFIGSINREYLQYYYSSADVTVVPSFYEPFGLVPLESMACGTLVVASKVGGMQWTIKDGKTGFLVPPRDPIALAEKIQYALEHPAVRKKMRENGIDRVSHFFSWDVIARGMEQFYIDFLLEYYYRKALNGKKETPILNKPSSSSI